MEIEILHGVRFSGARSKEAKAFPGRLQLQSYLFGVHPWACEATGRRDGGGQPLPFFVVHAYGTAYVPAVESESEAAKGDSSEAAKEDSSEAAASK